MSTRTIYKYELEITTAQTVTLPEDRVILSVANQNGKLCMWVDVNKEYDSTDDLTIYLFGTGHPIPSYLKRAMIFVGTVIIDPFVWHVYRAK